MDRILGALLGAAAGDALGATTEFSDPERIAAEHGRHTEIVGGGMFGWRPGQGTDDSDMLVAVARSYAEGYSLDDVAARFVSWYRTDPSDIGNQTAAALRLIAGGCPPREAGVRSGGEGSAGNGSLMRCLPTALVGLDPATRRAHAVEIGLVTHSDARCVQSCVAYVEAVAALVDGATVDDALAAGADAVPSLRDDVRAALTVAADTPVEALPTSGYVLDSLRFAAWALRQPVSAEDVLVDIVNRGGDSDTHGCIAGGALGARDGADAVPSRWADVLEYGPELRSLASVFVNRAR